MTWLTFALLATLGFGIAPIFGKKLVTKLGNPYHATFVSSFFLAFVNGIVVWVTGSWEMPSLSNLAILYYCAFIGFIGLICMFRAFEIEKIGIVITTATTFPIMVYFISLVIYPIAIGTQQVAAIFVVFAGVVLISWDQVKKLRLSKGMMLAFVTSFGWASYAICIRAATDSGLNSYMAVFTTEVFLFLSMLVLVLIKDKGFKVPLKDGVLPLAMGNGTATGMGAMLYGVALGLGHPAAVSSIESTNPLLTSLLAFVFFKEALQRSQWVGIVVVIGGVILLAI